MRGKILAILLVNLLVATGFPAVTVNAESTQTVGSYSTDDNYLPQKEMLMFGPRKDISTLDINGIVRQKTFSISQEIKEKTRVFHFDLSQCVLHRMDMKQFYLEIKELEPYGPPGAPMLPMKTFTLEIPKNSEVIEVGLLTGYYREIKNKVDIIPNPQPVFWSPSTIKKECLINTVPQKTNIYNSDRFYPGTVVSYDVGENNMKKLVFVRVYPVQYLPKLRKTVLITDGVIRLYYKVKKETFSPSSSAVNGSLNVIITHPSLFNQALELKNFHDTEETTTYVVNTTWIYDHYQEADDPPYDGYSNPVLPRREIIQGYNYSLAKRIIMYLNDTAAHPNLTYVTLLGNARLVPPSYYHFSYDWVPTDFFYASPDYDLVPNYFVGRLPVNNSEEAAHVVNKIRNWDAFTGLFRNITIAGGKPFSTPYDIGELIAVDAVNRGFFKGIKPRKCFKTEKSFDKANLTQPLTGNTGVLYHIGHGSGDAWFLEGDPLSVEDVLNLSASNTTPVVISIACMNGAFDTHLVDTGFNLSFGESILLSDAGGIAYIGGARSNAGSPVFIFDNGYLSISKETYMAGMLTYLLERYYEGGSTLGDLTANAMVKYVEHNNFSDPLNKFTFFAFVLLGDPALKLPIRPTGVEYQIPYPWVEDPLNYIDAQAMKQSFTPIGNGEIPLSVVGENMKINSSTNSLTVDIKLVDTLRFDNATIEKKTNMVAVNGKVIYEFQPLYGSLYSIRVITGDGKEGWLYATAARIVDDDFDETTPGWNVLRWSRIQDAVDHCADSDVVYVFSGIYKENIRLDKSIKLIGENKDTTVIDGDKQGNVVEIHSPLCSVSGFTVTNSGSHNNGLAVKADMTTVYDDIITYNNVGVKVSNGFFSLLQHSVVSNNVYGVYLENNVFSYIIGNNISGNQFGFYLIESTIQYILGNTVMDNHHGVYLQESDSNFIFLNNFTANKQGVYLEKSDENMVMINNFINNGRHAKFYRCRKNVWLQNYWDNWVGLRITSNLFLPKFIFGRTGVIDGLIPWVNIDPLPAKTLNPIYVPL